MYTTHSYAPIHYAMIYARALESVIAEIPQTPSEVQIRYENDPLNLVTLSGDDFRQLPHDRGYTLSSATWTPLDGVRMGTAWLSIEREASCFTTYNSGPPEPEGCFVGLLRAGFRYDPFDNSSASYLHAANEQELVKILVNRMRE